MNHLGYQQSNNSFIEDAGMRSRDERFKDQGKHKQKPDSLTIMPIPKSPRGASRRATFTSTRTPVLALVRLARRSTATARTASTTAMFRPSTPAASATAYPAHCASDAYALEKTIVRQVTFFRDKADATAEVPPTG